MTVDIRGSLDSCVKCTVCETFCPVAAVTPLFPGPKYAGPQSERYRHPGVSVDASLDYCSGCGICTQVCPQGVDIAEINARARAEMKAAKGMSVRDRLIARPDVLGRMTRPVAPLANAAMRTRPARRVLEGTLGIHRDAALPNFASSTFQKWAGRHQARRARPAPSSISMAVLPTTTSRASPGWRSPCSSTTASR